MNQRTQTIKTTCPYCGVGCGMEISARPLSKNFQVKVIGDQTHPANYGRLCVKGSAAGETVDLEGRMQTPQIQGQPVDWDTALQTIADKIRQTINDHGPDAIAFYVSGQLLTEDYYVANKLMKGFIGSGNIDTNSRLCMSSAVAGYKRAFGSDTVPCSYEDLDLADLIVLVGSNTAWAHPIVYQRIVAAKKARPHMKIVVIDPRRTATCDIADLHLPLKPGSDAALYNGLLAHLAQQQALDHTFIEQHTEHFAAALQQAQQQQGTLAEVAQQCELNETDLALFYKWCQQTPKMVTLYSQGINQSTSGVDKSNAIINCHLATGRIGKPGMGPFSITGQPNAMGGREVGGLANQLAAHMDFANEQQLDLVRRFWQAENMATQNGLKAVDMMQAVADGRIKVIWIINTNPVDTMPDADAVKAALRQCEMTIVSDCLQHTDTTEVADILLPALTWGEIDGTVTNSDRTLSRQRKFMEGPEMARPDWWILCQVAQKLGFKGFDYQSPAEIFREHIALSAFENNGTRDFDLSGLLNLSDQAYDELTPIQWPIHRREDNSPQGTKRMFSDGRFFTPSGRAQFIPITPRSPQSHPNAKLPFILNTGRIRDQWHTMTRTAKTAKLMAHIDEPFVAIHPADAQAYQLKNNQLAKIENELGTVIARIKIDQGQRQGSLFIPMHWNAQYASHARVDTLVRPYTDPISGQPESKHSTVSIAPYPAQWYGFILSKHPINTDAIGGYWVKIKGNQFYRYEIAGEPPIEDFNLWSQAILQDLATHAERIDYEDPAQNRYRTALLKNHQLQAALFIAPTPELPPRNWLGSLFTETELDNKTRLNLLAGQLSGAKDEGRIICSCFGIGINTIIEAIQTDKLTSVEAIGQALKAGTNCGSCIPELTEILTQTLKP